MTYKVLIVDDSNFFQMRLKEIINEHSQLNVVGVASNGREAIELAEKLKPDVISMDYEMPMLDGLSAVRIIMNENPLPIIMFSSMTYEGAKITLDALDAGAVDFMNKNFAEVSNNSAAFKKKLHDKLLTFAKGNASLNTSENTVNDAIKKEEPPAPSVHLQRSQKTPARTREESKESVKSDRLVTESPVVPQKVKANLKGKVRILVIGASTGGPVALAQIINALPSNFPVPIVIVQHMPENFTRAFAERLNRQAQLSIKEAENGDRLTPGSVFVAPGGKQLMFDKQGVSIKIIDGDDRVNYKPCVDISFASAANSFNDSVLGLVLTGMGADGCDGARLLKQKGSVIWSQDEQSCVVYGMPAAVDRANLSDSVLPLDGFADRLKSDL